MAQLETVTCHFYSRVVLMLSWKSCQAMWLVHVSARLPVLQFSGERSQRTFSVAEVSRRKQPVDVHQGEHGDRADQRAHLCCSSTPHQGAVAPVPQDDTHHYFDVRQRSSEEEPREHLARAATTNSDDDHNSSHVWSATDPNRMCDLTSCLTLSRRS